MPNIPSSRRMTKTEMRAEISRLQRDVNTLLSNVRDLEASRRSHADQHRADREVLARYRRDGREAALDPDLIASRPSDTLHALAWHHGYAEGKKLARRIARRVNGEGW